MVLGRDIRLSRILKKDRMLCIPMDHGISNGPIPGLENIHSVIYQCEKAGLTCVLVNKGIIKTLPRAIDIGLIVHLSGSTSIGPAPNGKVLMGSVEEALRLGADAVSVHINIGAKEEPEMLYNLGMISDKCDEWNIPLIAMMYPRGETIKNQYDPEIVAHTARIGAEAGADIVKSVYTGEVNSFRKVVKSCPVPIVIAGGPKTKTDKDVVEMCFGAMQAGAKGITFGRNIFQHRNPPAIIRALSNIILGGKSSKEAFTEIDKNEQRTNN
ncbi:MAG TPA: 2-amino-3,7-dideoxy-D-threo-hept-6-ulosonate synthase [Nitrososphaeraceae archaeon]|nr:2-amino-3,7-dideoxy-D-threo-hept-6-ulosonate synthase [Nitrososphaeraceae archaeon]